MQRLPIGIQSFKEIRTGDYRYIDKTAIIYRLISSGKYFFLARPRRFGKSLTLSTMKAFFEGQRDLFHGLAIEHLEQQWNAYPVFHLDFNTGDYSTLDGLNDLINYQLCSLEQKYNITSNNTTAAVRFKNIITQATAQTGQKIVLLIDEYDKPLVHNIDNPDLQAVMRNVLKSIYSVVKSCDEMIHFAFITGVTKFSKVSIFSDLNNISDISLDRRYTSLCGITHDELLSSLSDYIEDFAHSRNTDTTTILQQLQKKYDGYHFSADTTTHIYNPYSLLKALEEKEFVNNWFESGTPTFLVKLLQQRNYDLQQFCHGEITTNTLTSKDSLTNSPIILLYQTGYLTIKNYDSEFETYHLGFPNQEVEQGFLNYLLPAYTQPDNEASTVFIQRFVLSLRAGDIDSFIHLMQSFFADTPYELIDDNERHYQTVMFIICRLMGYYSHAEYHTNHGRIDMIIATDNYRYIFEFKFDHSAEEALHQIDSKDYSLPFASDPSRTTYKVGINFSSQTRNIDQYLISEA